MQHQQSKVVVLGAAAAGLGTVAALVQRGIHPLVIDAAYRLASSLRNQKWLQSGYFYLYIASLAAAQELWRGFRATCATVQPFLLQRGAHFLVIDEETLQAREALAAQCNMPFDHIAPGVLPMSHELGPAQYMAGYHAPDTVVDFPEYLRFLRHTLASSAQIIMGATVTKLVREGDRLSGLIYKTAGGEEVFVTCDVCIVTLGAWAVELLRAIDVDLPVQRSWSPLFTVEGELVDRITAWVDGPRLTLVPYKSRTLIANARRVAVDTPTVAQAVVQEEIEILKAQLLEAFPKADMGRLTVLDAYGCVKTEFSAPGARNQNFAIFNEANHGVQGLIVGFPGKASLMLRLGEVLATCVAPSEKELTLASITQ